MEKTPKETKVAVVIPAYGVADHILSVLSEIGHEASLIYVVDDQCPQKSGELIQEQCKDTRVKVVFNKNNLGVGGATLVGYRLAMADGADIIVKLDGDGQMNPKEISRIIAPVVQGIADYAKGNRFFNIEDVKGMPKVRLVGNLLLSFLAKLSTGYWDIFDPTNGFTAIDARVIKYLPLDKISSGYFFESDLLFRLNILGCVVQDVPHKAAYGDEISNLLVHKEVFVFFRGHLKNTLKRIGYNYFLRDFSLASIELVLGLLSLAFGFTYGLWKWISLASEGEFASSGVVMIAALPIIIGMQLLLSAINYDVQRVPRTPFTRLISAEGYSD